MLFTGQNVKHVHVAYHKLLIFFSLTSVEISHCIKEILPINTTPKETNDQIKAKRYIFSHITDGNAEESMFS